MQNMNGGKSALGLDANVAALLAYIPFCFIGLIVSILIIVQDKTNKLARFHAFQSLLLTGLAIVLYIVIMVVGAVAMAANSTILSLFVTLLYLAVVLAVLGAIVFCCIKAFQGQLFKLPVIGDMADKWSN